MKPIESLLVVALLVATALCATEGARDIEAQKAKQRLETIDREYRELISTLGSTLTSTSKREVQGKGAESSKFNGHAWKKMTHGKARVATGGKKAERDVPAPTFNATALETLRKFHKRHDLVTLPLHACIVHHNDWPWDEYPAYKAAMDLALGSNWEDMTFDGTPASIIFSSKRQFVWLEGGDDHHNELEAYMLENRALIEFFVGSGGVLYINGAPNEGDGLNDAFFGATHTFTSGTTYFDNGIGLSHPITSGPFGAFSNPSGYSLAHGYYSAIGGTKIIHDSSDVNKVLLSETIFRAGRVIHGCLTSPGWIVNGVNLHANIISYASTSSNRRTSGSCADVCGGWSSGCYCDTLCVGYGDCCADFHHTCHALDQYWYSNTCFGALPTGAALTTYLNQVLQGAGLLSAGGGGSIATGNLFRDAILDFDSRGARVMTVKNGCTDPSVTAAISCMSAFAGNPNEFDAWWHPLPPSLVYTSIATGLYRAPKVFWMTNGTKCQFINPGETGAGNSLVPIFSAQVNNLPLLDLDAGGRAVPFLYQTFWANVGIASPVPVALVSVRNISLIPNGPNYFGVGDGVAFNTIDFFPYGSTSAFSDPILNNAIPFSATAPFGDAMTFLDYAIRYNQLQTNSFLNALYNAQTVGTKISAGDIAGLTTYLNGCKIKNQAGKFIRINAYSLGSHEVTQTIVRTNDNAWDLEFWAFNENALLYIRPASGSSVCDDSPNSNAVLPSGLPTAYGPDIFGWVAQDGQNGNQWTSVSTPDLSCNRYTNVNSIFVPLSSYWSSTVCAVSSPCPSSCIGTYCNCWCQTIDASLGWGQIYSAFPTNQTPLTNYQAPNLNTICN